MHFGIFYPGKQDAAIVASETVKPSLWEVFTSFEISMAKGNSVELKTFKSYGVDEIIGLKNGREGWTNLRELYLV